tara:strand:- start:778 stop:918 length:141 start_codon:yes stop_codon:yes gene_type:complete
MSIQTKVPDFEMFDEYNEKFEKTTTEQERLEVIREYQNKLYKIEDV